MIVKVNYDATSGEIKGFYPEGIGYASIPTPTIEINETAHQDCINNQGARRVDLTTLKIVEYTPPEPTAEELKSLELAKLDAEYEPQFFELAQAWTTASMDGNTTLADQIKQDKADLRSEYDTKREAILNG